MMGIVARPESDPKTPLAERLRQVRKNLGDIDREAFADLVGISKNTLAHYERGERTPDADVLLRYRDHCHVDMNWLVSGDTSGAVVPPAGEVFTYLPFYEEVEAAAGHGATVVADAAHSVMGFARDLLREAGASPHHCTVIRARGDSMAPTLPEGALLVVDRSQQEIVANGSIMVVGVENDLLVKRIRRRLDGMIELISDNPAYPPETIGRDTIEQLRVVGRVVYFCRVP